VIPRPPVLSGGEDNTTRGFAKTLSKVLGVNPLCANDSGRVASSTTNADSPVANIKWVAGKERL